MALNVSICKAQFRAYLENRGLKTTNQENKNQGLINIFSFCILLTGMIFVQGTYSELITSNNSGYQDCEMITTCQKIYYT